MYKKRIIFFIATLIFSAFFLIENLNFLYNQNSILFPNFGANSAVADSYQYFHNFKKMSLVDFFVNFFLDFYNNYKKIKYYFQNN